MRRNVEVGTPSASAYSESLSKSLPLSRTDTTTLLCLTAGRRTAHSRSQSFPTSSGRSIACSSVIRFSLAPTSSTRATCKAKPSLDARASFRRLVLSVSPCTLLRDLSRLSGEWPVGVSCFSRRDADSQALEVLGALSVHARRISIRCPRQPRTRGLQLPFDGPCKSSIHCILRQTIVN